MMKTLLVVFFIFLVAGSLSSSTSSIQQRMDELNITGVGYQTGEYLITAHDRQTSTEYKQNLIIGSLAAAGIGIAVHKGFNKN